MTEKDVIVGLNNIAAKYGYGKGTEPFTNDEWNTIFRAKGIIKHLTAENQRLQEEAAEQKSIAAHEHATQMEWFSIAGDYKTENAELRHRAEVAERALLFLCDKTMSDISAMVFPNTKTQVANKQELYDYCIEKAEKELAEEREDD